LGQADGVIRGVFLLLTAMSLATWSVTFYKIAQYRRAQRHEDALAANLVGALASAPPPWLDAGADVLAGAARRSATRRRAARPDTVLRLAADGAVAYERVARVLAQARAGGAERLALGPGRRRDRALHDAGATASH